MLLPSKCQHVFFLDQSNFSRFRVVVCLVHTSRKANRSESQIVSKIAERACVCVRARERSLIRHAQPARNRHE